MAAWRYEISLQHLKRNFVSPSGHVISSIYLGGEVLSTAVLIGDAKNY